jgi:Ni,Fe-hydrogenase III large subunit
MATSLDHRFLTPLSQSPWPHYAVDQLLWRRLGDDLAAGRATLLSLWAEPDSVHLCLLDEAAGRVAIVSLAAVDGRFPSIARRHVPALRLERSIRDLTGLSPEGCPDLRPWLNHDQPYSFLPAEGPGVHEIAVGPIHAGVIEPGHFRFSVNGETVVRLEARLGYCYRGVEQLMLGQDLATAGRMCARICGDSTVAYSYAFAVAVEQALNVVVPQRGQWLRALMAELERVANHLGDIGFICNDAAMAVLHAQFGALREEVLQSAEACLGHRLMMDRVVPGGVASDLDDRGRANLLEWLTDAERRFARLIEIYDNSASLKERTLGTGILSAGLAARFGAGGFVGRASGRAFDARKQLPYAPYPELDFSVTVLNRGDVNARLWVRQCEVRQSFGLIRNILALLPPGEVRTALPTPAGASEGLAIIEGFRGDILFWLRLDDAGRVAASHARDPSWFQWPLLEAAIAGNIVADFPLCNKSFNCSYAGVDR